MASVVKPMKIGRLSGEATRIRFRAREDTDDQIAFVYARREGKVWTVCKYRLAMSIDLDWDEYYWNGTNWSSDRCTWDEGDLERAVMEAIDNVQRTDW